MELALHRRWKHPKQSTSGVSILVLMELALHQDILRCIRSRLRRFNPCFNGISSSSFFHGFFSSNLFGCFNPCFNGISSSSYFPYGPAGVLHCVSILVLMELALHLAGHRRYLACERVSILVLMELALHPSGFIWHTPGLYGVSILVLMELALHQSFKGSWRHIDGSFQSLF